MDFCAFNEVIDLVIELFTKMLFNVRVVELSDLQFCVCCCPSYIVHTKFVSKTAVLDSLVPIDPDYLGQFFPTFSLKIDCALFILLEDVRLTVVVYHILG